MTKAFDTVNIHQLIHKIHNTHISTTIIKFLANYLKGRRQYLIQQSNLKTHKHQSRCSPRGRPITHSLQHIPLRHTTPQNQFTQPHHLCRRHHHNINTATQNFLPYLNEIPTCAHNNNLQINPTKTTSTLMTPDPSEYNRPLNIHINNIPISTTSNPTILGLTFDPKLKFSTHTDNTIT